MSNKRVLASLLGSLIALLGAMSWASAADAQDSGLSIVIEWPNEGETLYAGPTSLLYKAPIKGRVSSDDYAAEEITVGLVILKDESAIGVSTTSPDEEGYYEFYATVNPGGPTEQFEIAFVDCGIDCHSPAEVDFQPGRLTLKVTATDPDGRQAVAERNILVDISGQATIPVHVSLAGEDNQPVSDIDVLASTRIYLWRARFAAGRSDATGLAAVQVEALSQAPTTYVLKISPTIVNGTLYEGIEPVEVSLEPGAIGHAPIELKVTAQQGQISGQLSSAENLPLDGIPVWAIRLPGGASLQTVTDESGKFEFSEAPLDQYLIALDNEELALAGLAGSNEEIDLAEVIQATLDISLKREQGERLSGRITAEDGSSLPFGWAMVEGVSGWQTILPGSDGQFTITGLPDETVKVVVSAPGYYGRVMTVQPDPAAGVDLTLTRREGTGERPWEAGSVVIPAGSEVREQSGLLILDRGWLWGQSSGGDSFTFQIESAKVTLNAGRFAVEYLPGQLAWFYLLDGSATIDDEDLGQPVVVTKSQMVNLLNEGGLEAVPLDPVVMAALEPSRRGDVPLVWQPGLNAQIRDRIARLGVGAAQVVTFVTYFVLILFLILAPLIGIHWWWRKRHTKALEQ